MDLIYQNQKKINSIHYNESIAEKDFLLNKKGDFLKLYEALKIDISFFDTTKKRSIFNSNVDSQILVHNVITDANDLKNIIKNSSLSICANANLYIGNELPDLYLLEKSNFNICLGTDSLASNKQLNFKEEIKTIQHNFPKISLQTILKWATINGAKALCIDDKYGSFEQGKIGSFVILD